MRPVKKIEIVVDSLGVKEIVRALDQIGVSGYTIIKDVEGKGGSGIKAGDQLVDVLKNSYILTVCDESQTKLVTDSVRPILKRFGGVCLVSDALWLEH